jgi:hypothetical protein
MSCEDWFEGREDHWEHRLDRRKGKDRVSPSEITTMTLGTTRLSQYQFNMAALMCLHQ